MTGSVTPLKGKESDKPKLDTITSLESVFTIGPNEWQRINPDQLVRQKGLRIFGAMRLDDQVKAASTFKRDAIVSRGWTFSYDDSSSLSLDEQQKRIDMFEDIIDAFPGSFVDALNAVAAGRDYGFSLVEKVFSAVDLDDGTAIGISALKFRDPNLFEFITDGYGELVEFRQRAGGQIIKLNLSDFIYYVHAPEVEPYFGSSDLRAAYKYWYMKGRIQDYWGQFLERLAGGFAVLTAKDGSAPKAGTTEYFSMQALLANLRGAAGLLVPQGMEFKLEQIGSTDEFEKAITFFDLGIARSMLVPNLLGASHTGRAGGGVAGSGQGSQSQTQLESFYWTLQQDQARLEACLNQQLFKPLARYNFADEDGPVFGFKPLSEERLRWLVQTWVTMVSGGTVVATEEDEAYLRKLLDMPARDTATSQPVITPDHQLQQDQMNQDAQQAKDALTQKAKAQGPSKTIHALEQKIEALELKFAALEVNPVEVHNHIAPSPAIEPTPKSDATEGTGHVHVHPMGKLLVPMAAFTAAVQRVAFAVIEQRQMAATEQVTADAAACVAGAVARLLTAERMAKVIASPDKIPNVKLSGDEVGRLKAIVKAGLVNSYVDGVATSRNEIDRSGYQMSASGPQRMSFGNIKNVAADYLDANGFRIGGNVSDATRAIIQQELLNGVKSGMPVAEIRQAIWDRLVAKGMTSAEAALGVETDEGVNNALDQLWADTPQQAASYLSTLVRTNLFDAFNEGRFAEFTDPALGDFVAALQYSAILDDRTTEICQSLDGSVYDTDNPVWDTYRPPNHYNCRSVLVGITQVDINRGEWDGQESDLPAVEPHDGFGKGDK
jgi:SPP1 gp7 family putative phage head morphogenesis protein